jgi:ubiquinone/menaquinone biosynthesis C-methylase UbiE
VTGFQLLRSSKPVRDPGVIFKLKEKAVVNDYVLETGKKGFDRLKFLNNVFGMHSRNFLNRAGLCEGQTVLEIGCGTGFMTGWIGQQVGETGHVIAVDASDKQIEIAKQSLKNQGISNVTFLCSTAEELNLDNDSVDLAYARFLLMHLKDVEHVLQEIKDKLRSGGIVAFEEPHSSSLETKPTNESIEKLNRLFVQLGRSQGFNFDIGDNLFSLLRESGYTNLYGCFVQPIISMDEAIDFVLMGASEISPIAKKLGMLNADETDKIETNLKKSKLESAGIYIFPRQAQIYGRKE